MRCVFSETLKVKTLEVFAPAPSRGLLSRVPPVASLLRTSARWSQALVDDLVTTVFPADCRCCREPLTHAGLSPVCELCLQRVRPQAMTLCQVCGEALEMDLEGDRFDGQAPLEGIYCRTCRFVPPPFERAVAFGVYENELREMVHLLKYEHMASMARPLGLMLAQSIATLGLAGEVLLVTVPLFPAKQRQRGYNQAVLLADAAVVSLRKAQPALRLVRGHYLLRRVRDTESQFALSAKGRRTNLQGAFRADDVKALAGRTVLLVDDIYTTGATARECARVLVRAGAAKVYVATLSRAQSVTRDVALWDGGAGQRTGTYGG